jgi:hypothetical protein
MNTKNKASKANKKAITPLVSTIMIIGIAIILVSVAGILIINAVRKPLLSPAVSCNELLSSSSVKIDDICYNEQTNELRVEIQRPLNSLELNSLSFELTNSGKTMKWTCGTGCSYCLVLQPGETKFYYLSPGEQMASDASLAISAEECLIERETITNKCS